MSDAAVGYVLWGLIIAILVGGWLRMRAEDRRARERRERVLDALKRVQSKLEGEDKTCA